MEGKESGQGECTPPSLAIRGDLLLPFVLFCLQCVSFIQRRWSPQFWKPLVERTAGNWNYIFVGVFGRALEDALSLDEDGERRFIFDEIFPCRSIPLPKSSYSNQGNELEDCYSTKVASLSREAVKKRRLVRSLRHWSIRCDKRAPCILHKKRLHMFYHCLDCGIPLHAGVCHRIFHSVADISSVNVDEKFCK